MKLKILGFLTFTLLLLCFFTLGKKVFAVSESDCLNKSASDLTTGEMDECLNIVLPRIAAAYAPAQEKNKQDLANLKSQLTSLNNRIISISNELKAKEKEIRKHEEDMAFAQKILDEKARSQYIDSRLYDPVLSLISASDASEVFRRIKLREVVADEDRKTIEKYSQDLLSLKEAKANLEKNKISLASLQKQVNEQTKFLQGEVDKVDTYLASISAKQQAFIEAKLESLGLSRSAYNMKGGCSSDINPFKSPGFDGPIFAFFTYGVPNRVGMNQYGAKGRAEAGKTYDQILHAYYNFDSYQNFDAGIQIKVNNGNGINKGSVIWSGGLEDYIRRIYEVPDGWPVEVLKAQAIAARSYVLAATNNGNNSICANEYCQVFKTGSKGGNWEQAVIATQDGGRGKVMVQGGQPIKAWFSATHGGYAYNSGDIGWNSTLWTKRMVDTPSGSVGSFSDLLNNAYDRSSPVFYCDWGSHYNKTAWLKPDELADIVNAVLLAKKDGSTKAHLYQTDKPNPEGTDTWDAGRVKSELGGFAFNTITNVSVGVDFGTGRTTTVTVNGDAAAQTINGDDFKNYFNLRAPANIQIVGPLYNVEKR